MTGVTWFAGRVALEAKRKERIEDSEEIAWPVSLSNRGTVWVRRSSDVPEFPTDQDRLDFLIHGQNGRQEVGGNPDGSFGDGGRNTCIEHSHGRSSPRT